MNVKPIFGAALLALSVMLHLWTGRLFRQADVPTPGQLRVKS